MCILGCVIMIAADGQKYFTLRLQRGLITDGLYRYIRHPNYLGEMMIYGSFALMVCPIGNADAADFIQTRRRKSA